MKNFTMTFWAAGCALLFAQASDICAADAQLWKTYCDDARKSADERRFTEANQFAGMALGVAEQFGEADLRLIETLFLAASIQAADKHFDEAEPHLRRALALREAKLGTNDINVAECAFHLGGNLSEQRKFTEAETQLKRAEHIAKWKAGSYHPVTATCQAALARSYYLAGRYAEADKLYVAALKVLGSQSSKTTFSGPNEILESVFMPNYQRVTQMRTEQALCLHNEKKYKEAEEAFKKVVKLVEDVAGKDSPLLSGPLLAFAHHYADMKKYPAAEALLLRRQTIITKAVGEKHPEQLKTIIALEQVYRAQGKTAEADLLVKQLAEAGVKPAPAK